MSKFYLAILISIIIIGAAVTIIVLNPEAQEKIIPTPIVSSGSTSIEEINNLITQIDDYEAKLKITSSSGTYEGYVYVASAKTKAVYNIDGKRFFSVTDSNKNEIVNYDLKSKKGIKIPGQVGEKETIFKKLPDKAEIIRDETINDIDCWVVEIKQKDEIEILWISKENGIIIKKEIITHDSKTTFELTEIENKKIAEEEMDVPLEIEIIELTSEEFISFVQENTDAHIIISLPSLPAASVEPVISSIIELPSFEEQSETQSPSSPHEGIFEETHPKAVPIY